MSLPVGLRVSSRFTAHGQHHQADAPLRQVGLYSRQLGRAARQSIRLGDCQHVVSVTRLAVLDTYSPNMRSAPADLASARCSGLGEVARPISGASVFCLLQ